MDNSQPLITAEGFSDFSDVSTEDIVPWTPLRAGQNRRVCVSVCLSACIVLLDFE